MPETTAHSVDRKNEIISFELWALMNEVRNDLNKIIIGSLENAEYMSVDGLRKFYVDKSTLAKEAIEKLFAASKGNNVFRIVEHDARGIIGTLNEYLYRSFTEEAFAQLEGTNEEKARRVVKKIRNRYERLSAIFDSVAIYLGETDPTKAAEGEKRKEQILKSLKKPEKITTILADVKKWTPRSWGIKVHLDIPANDNDLMVDVIGGDVRNLCRNAVKNASKEEHGHATDMTISVRRITVGNKEIARVTLRDNGLGFSAPAAEKFRKNPNLIFQKGQSSKSKGEHGLGFRDMDKRLSFVDWRAYEPEGGGLVVEVDLPIAEPQKLAA